MRYVHQAVDDALAIRKDNTGKSWTEIFDLGIQAAERQEPKNFADFHKDFFKKHGRYPEYGECYYGGIEEATRAPEKKADSGKVA